MKNAILVVLSILTLIAIVFLGNNHWNNKIAEAGKTSTVDTATDEPVSEPSDSTTDVPEETPSENSTVTEIAATDDAWLYTHGNWDEVEIEDWGTVMQGTLKSTGEHAYGRTAKILTNSSHASIKQRKHGGTVTIFVDGELLETQELPNDGFEREIDVLTDSTGWHEIELVFSDFAEVSGLYIDKDAEVKKPESSDEKLVVIGHNYGKAPKDRNNAFTTIMENQLGIEVVHQGIPDSDLNMNSPEGENDSGLDRMKEDVMDENPTAVLVVYGNPALANADETFSYGGYFEDYVTFIEEIKSELPEVDVYVSEVLPSSNVSNDAVGRLNQNIFALTWTVNPLTYVTLSEGWSSSFYAESNSLTPEGHQVVAERYVEAIQENNLE